MARAPNPAARVAAVRRFNRFYTSQIGVLQAGLLASPFTLAEVRVLYEIAHRRGPAAKDLAADLGMDRGYLSRILERFEGKRLIARKRGPDDARQRQLALTAVGQRTFADLDARASGDVRRMLAEVSDVDQRRLVEAMATIEDLLAPRSAASAAPLRLRRLRPGDLGWVVQRHGELYAEEQGWDTSFEALVAKIAARFVEHLEPARERAWIAERGGERLGSVFLVKKSTTVAQLRLLLVEPKARGAGIGAALVSACERFARRAGYRKVRLWTQSVLAPARRVYERAGYRLISEQPHHSFGARLVAQIWERVIEGRA